MNDSAPAASLSGPTPARAPRDASAAWRSPLTRATLALLVFLILGGVWIFAAPFSAFSQYAVLLHTVVGVAFLAPFVVYQTKHFLETWRRPFNHVLLLGYLGGLTVFVAVVSGVVLTWQACAGPRISPFWRQTHAVSGLSLTALVGLHVAFALVLRTRGRRAESTSAPEVAAAGDVRRRGRGALARAGFVTAALFVLQAGGAALYAGLDPAGSLPADYGFKYGENPFAPSLAKTASGGAIAPAALAGSASCGSSGCHEQIAHEWAPSAHRYASRSFFFQAIQKTMADNNGAESTRYCAGCHDPIALFSGAKNIYDTDLSSPGADEGVSCAACHSITHTDVKGNADYVMTPPRRYLFEEVPGAAAKLVSDFLIRAYPDRHVAAYARDLYKTPEFCGACHKQFIDKEINRVGWVQLQNQYDNWRKSHWFKGREDDPSKADEKRTLACRECHMRLSSSSDPAAGDAQDFNRRPDDGLHRNHRFIGANQWAPKLHDLPGADEQVRLTEEWLRGETVVPEIADRWTTGPAVTLELIAPESVAPGDDVRLKALVASNKVGHDFPTGPLDIIQSWVAVEVVDGAGRKVFSSGEVDPNGFVQEGAFMFKAEGVDKAGNLIDRHNLWEMVGARFRRSLFPGFTDSADFEFSCPSALARVAPLPPETEAAFKAPSDGVGELRVAARVRYRKVDQTLLNFVSPNKRLEAPITDMAHARATIRVVPRGE